MYYCYIDEIKKKKKKRQFFFFNTVSFVKALLRDDFNLYELNAFEF